MTDNLEMERLFQGVRLVRGKGDRRSGTACIMTFVALLAGDRHTDAPSTASPLVRQFAIVLNDSMPDTERQRLKPFAPGIVGTADGFDPGRAAVLRQAMQKEVFPRVRTDLEERVLPFGPLHDPCGMAAAHTAAELLCSLAAIAAAEDTARNQRKLALLAARLLTACAAAANSVAAREWYWAKAIDLLDRLCDMGSPGKRPDLVLARAEKSLSRDILAAGSMRRMALALRRLGHTLAASIGGATAAAEHGTPAAALPAVVSAVPEQLVVPGA
jgi:hypothetical protein